MSSSSMSAWWYMNIVLPICISWRMWLANRMPLMDCDEVYNYWEPLHFLLYGSGLQTWEYAHDYCLRTYAYLLPLMGYSRILQLLIPTLPLPVVPLLTDAVAVTSPKWVLFLLLRSSLAAGMAVAEVRFCHALERTKTVSPTVARWTLLVLQTAAGLAHASGALLPSTAWTVVWLWAAIHLVRHQPHRFVVVAVMASLSIGWPFGVVVLLPLAVHVLLIQTLPQNGGSFGALGSPPHVRGMARLLAFVASVAVVVQVAVLVVDHSYYGIWTSPNWNIFCYNAQAGGDELYGVEPTSYYIKNLLLNFNGVAILGVLSLPTVATSAALAKTKRWKPLIVTVLLLPMYVWFLIVVPRPHKEERFLFPIYPILCFGAVMTVEVLVEGFFAALQSISHIQATPTHRSIFHGLLWIPMAALSCLRILALKKYYAAPLTIYAALHSEAAHPSGKQLVCTCGEWHRFPSSFALPKDHELAFLPSSFRGQLPQPFSPRGSRRESQAVLQPFNDANRHEPARYSTLDDCHYVIDLQESSDCRVPAHATMVATAPFLDAEGTTSTLHRTLYIPGLHEQGVAKGTIHYQNYVLYKL